MAMGTNTMRWIIDVNPMAVAASAVVAGGEEEEEHTIILTKVPSFET